MHIATLKITDRYAGPLILKEGLRPFFLAASAWAALSMLLWVGMLMGYVPVPATIAAVDWHQHELLFGYTSAVIGGFMLTVAANWTGRPPVSGGPLLVLVLLWLAGRVVMYQDFSLSMTTIAAIDLMFPLALGVVVARELILGKNYRNLFLLAILGVYTAANALFHAEVALILSAGFSSRLGLSAVLFLIMVIGGRLIPAFTRNWLLKRNATRLPGPFGVYDGITLAVSLLVLLAWSFTEDRAIDNKLVGPGMLLAGVLQVGRLARWCGEKTFADPLVLILHIAYAFIPLGFFGMWAAHQSPAVISYSASIHLWTAGAVVVTCTAVMTRAGLGHTNQALAVSPLIVLIYVMLLSSVSLRFFASLSPSYMKLIQASAVLWCLAHLGFMIRYTRLFFTAR